MAQALPVLGITPFCSPDAGLVRALEAAGARGCLDLGTDPRKAERVLRRLGRQLERFAVRIGPTLPVLALPSAVDTVVLHPDVDSEPYADRVRLVQVTTHQQGVQAVAEGADGLIAKGAESGGLVSDTAAPILVQQLASLGVPVWLQGGVGLHTVSGAVALGAHGVVLDAQLALLEEANTPDPIRKVLATMDGSETTVVSGHRVFERPDLPIVALATGLPGNLGAGPLDRRLLPLGQDAAFAAPLAARFRTVAGLVHGLRESAHAQLETAAALQPLAPGNGVAAAHGSGYPIAQGPMTRVSDRAAFAEAVARGGGLPFLALSLSRGDKVRALVEETGLLLPNRPWGVGILGFVPPELRAEQLEVITELRPPLALIAGGRPSQARELEALDIPTFLHVPSPGLLDLFLRDGATRFVFEGRECGGHIGPRHSFVLWEQAVARLLEQGDLSDYELLFAGGIHDGATAAMIAALAAPLAARGARLGVLMGTAYLFTAEAVRSGAIGEVFQQAAVDATQTAAVQTAPGHATRCVRSPFVDAFEARRAELEAAGSSPEETWAEFEKLNLGRLRIASKGIVREGDTLTSVDEDRQRAEGMFMIGDVATLRDDRTTVAELHASVSEGSVAALARWAPRHTSQEEPGPVDVAIVGMAGFFPGAPDVETFWANILANHDAVTEVPPERWDAELYFDPDHVGGERTRSKWGGFLGEIPFDPVTYGIPPRSLAAIEPVQLLALEAAQRALVDAGYDRRVLPRARTSVLFGAEAGTDLAGAYGFRAVWPSYLGELPPELDAMLPKLTEDSFPGVLANVIAGRIANRLDLGGVNYTVDAACASSLAALDQACRELSTGSSDVVLCGGADLHNTINDYLLFSSTHALSPSGRCATFDANADGIALGESVSVVVLKRLADAERDGDRIYAVVRAVGGSSDGRSLGLTAPRKDGQVRALHRAYARAGVPASDVRLVEAHGTGTVVGDRTELETLTEVYESHAPGSVTLGSVKSQIGHTKCAAGLAGLIKVSLALHHRVLPPTLHVRNPNPGWDADDSPFGFRSRPAPWLGDRHAAVSAFGFGGTNFHAVLSAHDTAPTGAEAWPAELLVFRDAADLDRVDAHASANRPPTLRSLARALAARGDGPVVAAIVATDLDDLRARIADHRAGRTHERLFRAAPQTGKVGWLFPGQGSQRPGMLGDLLVHWPELHDLLQLGARWADRIYPADPFDPASRRAQRDAITDTRVAQPTLGIVDLAAARLLDALGLEPDAMAGHSYGELVALTVAGALSEDDLLALSETRGRCILAAAGGEPGTMLAASAPLDVLQPLLDAEPEVVAANLNHPFQTVLSGTEAGIDRLDAALEACGIGARRLPVAAAFHSPVVAGASGRFAEALAQVEVGPLSHPVYANLTAQPHDPEAVRETLAAHIAAPVRWVELIEQMYADGVRTFVEVGPGRVLSGLTRKILGDRPHLTVPVEPEADSGVPGFLGALAALVTAGHELDLDALFDARPCAAVDLEATPQTLSPTTWMVNGHRARPLHGEVPDHGLKIVTERISLGAPTPTAAGGRDEVVLSYLESMRQLAEAQRQAVLGYLGTAPPPIEVPVVVAQTAAPVLEATMETTELVVTLSPEDALLALVSDRTGYPRDMLDLDLDLEADLSIDSIKRIEILGALSEQLGLAEASQDARDALVEQLARVKTLRGILGWLAEQADGGAPEAIDAEPVEIVAEPAQLGADPAAPENTERFVPELAPAPINGAAGSPLTSRHIAVVGEGPVASALVARAEARGAAGRLASPDDDLADVDGIVWLADGSDPTDPILSLANTAKRVLTRGAVPILTVTDSGGVLGQDGADSALAGGVAGLTKSLAHEWPGTRLRRVDLDLSEPPANLAEHVLDELVAHDHHAEVGYRRGIRHTLVSRPAPLDEAARTAPLSEGDTLLVTGGARGITARVALQLAASWRPRLELVGRSPMPPEADLELADATTENDLRRRLFELGRVASPAEAARAARRELADREMRATFSKLDALGVGWRYHAVDVRDDAAFTALLDTLGPLHGVLHGAGVTEDKLLRDKTAESFQRVHDTKVRAALTLADHLTDAAKLVVFFSSVAGAYGNRGQTDYAAANATLDALARQLDARIAGRAVSINWGPWGGGGMVSPELAREYGRKGIALIEPDDGVARLLHELEAGSGSQVILMRAHPEQLTPRG